MAPATRKQVEELMADRPEKFTPEEVGYKAAPEGSALRCSSCFHMYVRVNDNHGVCELMRDDQVDDKGLDPAWRCSWWTADGEITPLAPED